MLNLNLKTKIRYHLTFFLYLQVMSFFGIFNDFYYILLESTIVYNWVREFKITFSC
jgi:hypothetical protein